MGAYYSSRANYDQAAEWYQKALNADPGSPAIQVALADLDLHLDNVSEGISHYEQAVNLAPAAPGYWLALANAYQSNERYADAETAYSRAITLEPDLTAAYIGWAEALRAQARWEEAQSTYKQGLAVTPTSAWLLSAYAGFLLDRGDEARALAIIEQAKENVQDVPTMIAIAALYDKVGKKETSEALLQTALAQEPGSVVALIALGDLYEAQGRTNDAQLLYKKVVALTPGQSTGYLRLAILANKAGDQEAADEYASEAQQVAPESFRR
jgi:tetratricopeptide (TPR) repeat protein